MLNLSINLGYFLFCSYSKGFGVVEILFGKEHFLNMPNCVLGIVFYSIQFILGKCNLALRGQHYASPRIAWRTL